jgi:hypothetical protein
VALRSVESMSGGSSKGESGRPGQSCGLSCGASGNHGFQAE